MNEKQTTRNIERTSWLRQRLDDAAGNATYDFLKWILVILLLGKKGRHIIPFDPDKAEMLPGNRFSIVINLAKRWNSKHINQYIGKLANLYIDLVYKGELIEDKFLSF